MPSMPSDQKVRLAAFEWLAEQSALYGEAIPRSVLQRGFLLDGLRIPLLGPQGIFKPSVLEDAPISISTVPSGPYDDGFSPDGLLRYRYRGTDPNHRDNVGLRAAMKRRLPLVYFHRITPGKYLAAWPVYVVADDRKDLTFTVAVDDVATVTIQPGAQPTQSVVDESSLIARRAYITSLTKKRVHQQSFRLRVLRAYREQCAFCRLKHEELLDAAHIIPDSDPEGIPSVNNGISLCKLHHAAYDSFIIGITPGHVIEVRSDVLNEVDGPMLVHGLQGLDGRRIELPRSTSQYPDPELLERRYQLFKAAV